MSEANPTVSYTSFKQSPVNLGVLGRVGEVGSRSIIIDCTDILTVFPEATITCQCRRVRDESPYEIPFTLDTDSQSCTVILSTTETKYPGRLTLELTATDKEGSRVYKSASLYGMILPSLSG